MQRSADWILTTHVGSLSRPADLHAMNVARRGGEKIDDGLYNARVRKAVSDIVRKQVDIGIDIVDEGEVSKPSFITYINERLGGFEVDRADRNQSPWAESREVRAFPEYYRPQLANVHTKHMHYLCTGPVSYRGAQQLKTDINNLKAALSGVDVADAFVPSTSVSSVEDWNRNVYYKSDEDYLFALAETPPRTGCDVMAPMC
jgi:5-methyltetrahydropteroyltriglutamate--homocysteine methyltransferase